MSNFGHCNCLFPQLIYFPEKKFFSNMATINDVTPNFCVVCNKSSKTTLEEFQMEFDDVDLHAFYCPKCNADTTLVLTDHGERVCSNCCGVVPETNFGGNVQFYSDMRSKYNRLFYQNEIIKQIETDDPKIRTEILLALYCCHKKREIERIAKKNFRNAKQKISSRYVRQLCKDVCTREKKIERNLDDKYWVELTPGLQKLTVKSETAKLPKDLSKFGENYNQIKQFLLTQDQFVKIREKKFMNVFYDDFFQQYRSCFKVVEHYFEFVRHEPNCPGNTKDQCKNNKCRTSMLSKYFLLNRIGWYFFIKKEKKRDFENYSKFLKLSDAEWRPNFNKLYDKYWKPLVHMSFDKILLQTLIKKTKTKTTK